MNSTEPAPQGMRAVRTKLLISLAINGLAPLLVYTLARLFSANDTLALTIGMAIPVMRTVGVWIWRRRLDWIGVLAVAGFVIGLGLSWVLGGSALPLELHTTLLAGGFGLLCLLSVVVRRPLLLIVAQLMARDNAALTNTPAHYSQAGAVRSLSQATLIVGVALVADAVAHVLMALTLPTEEFIGLSRLVTWVILGAGVAGVWLLRRRAAERQAADQQEHAA